MTWFKVDDSFYDHPKVFDAPDGAVALWTRAGCWAARNLTDGFVPAKLPARLCDDAETAIKELVERGLWRRTKGGYQFHDWTVYQPSAERVKATRAVRAEAGSRGGKAKAAKQAASKLLEAGQGVAKQNSAPTRPDPTRPQQGQELLPTEVGEPPALIPASSLPKKPKPGSDQDPDWVKFWAAYPKKASKEGARKSWRAAIKKAPAADIIAGAQRFRDDPNRTPQFTKDPTTWLNNGCWDDEPLPPRSNGHQPYQNPTSPDAYGVIT